MSYAPPVFVLPGANGYKWKTTDKNTIAEYRWWRTDLWVYQRHHRVTVQVDWLHETNIFAAPRGPLPHSAGTLFRNVDTSCFSRSPHCMPGVSHLPSTQFIVYNDLIRCHNILVLWQTIPLNVVWGLHELFQHKLYKILHACWQLNFVHLQA